MRTYNAKVSLIQLKVVSYNSKFVYTIPKKEPYNSEEVPSLDGFLFWLFGSVAQSGICDFHEFVLKFTVNKQSNKKGILIENNNEMIKHL